MEWVCIRPGSSFKVSCVLPVSFVCYLVYKLALKAVDVNTLLHFRFIIDIDPFCLHKWLFLLINILFHCQSHNHYCLHKKKNRNIVILFFCRVIELGKSHMIYSHLLDWLPLTQETAHFTPPGPLLLALKFLFIAQGSSGFSFSSFAPKTTASTGFGFGSTTTAASSGFGSKFMHKFGDLLSHNSIIVLWLILNQYFFSFIIFI